MRGRHSMTSVGLASRNSVNASTEGVAPEVSKGQLIYVRSLPSGWTLRIHWSPRAWHPCCWAICIGQRRNISGPQPYKLPLTLAPSVHGFLWYSPSCRHKWGLSHPWCRSRLVQCYCCLCTISGALNNDQLTGCSPWDFMLSWHLWDCEPYVCFANLPPPCASQPARPHRAGTHGQDCEGFTVMPCFVCFFLLFRAAITVQLDADWPSSFWVP